jgi:hypothetical protein
MLLLALPLALTLACVVPPGDAAQIRTLVREREAALASEDLSALYRLHDLDFRAVCSLERFRSMQHDRTGAEVLGEIEMRGSRAWATVASESGTGPGVRLDFVRDGGRWYLYDEGTACVDAGGATVTHG